MGLEILLHLAGGAGLQQVLPSADKVQTGVAHDTEPGLFTKPLFPLFAQNVIVSVMEEHLAAFAAGLQQVGASDEVHGMPTHDATGLIPLLPLLAQKAAEFVIVLHLDGGAGLQQTAASAAIAQGLPEQSVVEAALIKPLFPLLAQNVPTLGCMLKHFAGGTYAETIR